MSSSSELYQMPIRASLWKSVLLAGADRRVTIFIIGTCMVLVLLSRFALWPCLTSIALAVIGQLVGIRLANVDPLLIDVYLRHVSYKRVYPAKADISVPYSRIIPSIPKV